MQNVFLAILMLVTTLQPVKDEVYKPVVVLELFTSQGCSSCPSADALLDAVSTTYSKTNVITLSYHVDYWNYIGWKDPFSQNVFTEKQRAYSRKFFRSSIYTPQVVVNGQEHFVGSDKSIMEKKIKTYLNKSSENQVAIANLSQSKGVVKLDYKVNGNVENKTLRVALVIKERETSIDRGENKNRVLKNSNIVVEERYLNLNSVTGHVEITIPNLVLDTDDLSVIVLVQNADLGITAGSQMVL